jgi:hypothetical protein
LKPIKPFYAVH